MASPTSATPAATAARRRVFETVLREQSLQIPARDFLPIATKDLSANAVMIADTDEKIEGVMIDERMHIVVSWLNQGYRGGSGDT